MSGLLQHKTAKQQLPRANITTPQAAYPGYMFHQCNTAISDSAFFNCCAEHIISTGLLRILSCRIYVTHTQHAGNYVLVVLVYSAQVKHTPYASAAAV